MSHPRLSQTFAWPVAIAATTLAGLALGLLGTGWVDVLAVILLAGPAAYCVRSLLAATLR